MAIEIGSGITFEGGITVTGGAPTPPAPSGNGVVTFTEMTAGGNIQQWLQGSANATMTSDGFILGATSGSGLNSNGVAIAYLSANNDAFFSTYGTGNRTATWSSGSSYTTMTVNLTQNNPETPEAPAQIVFFMNQVTVFPATFVFPVTFS